MKGCIILIHGLFMNNLVMNYLRINLQNKGYYTLSFSYPTIRNSMQENTANLAKFIELQDFNKKYENLPLHFVGHSLGGLLIRLLYEEYPHFFTGRIVTLGTPHQGSLIADLLQKNHFSNKLLSRAYLHSLDGNLPPWKGIVDLGSIAGTRAIGIGNLFNLPEPNDGTVLEEETKLINMRDHTSINCSHTTLIYSRKVCNKIDNFLQHGHF